MFQVNKIIRSLKPYDIAAKLENIFGKIPESLKSLIFPCEISIQMTEKRIKIHFNLIK